MTFPNKSLGTHGKATNADLTMFLTFQVEHCLYSFLQIHECQQFDRDFGHVAAGVLCIKSCILLAW